jgi:hypothetical protein
MPALTETEATARAALIDVASYDVFADLTAEPQGSVRTRTEIRFGCREPGAATFAELTATAIRTVLNGRELDRPAGEPVPDAVVLNDGDLTYAEISFDPASLDALAAAAMDVGDPLTEAVCWDVCAVLAARSVPRRWG